MCSLVLCSRKVLDPYYVTTQNNELSDLFKGSEPLFSMYLERTEEEDKMMAKSWKGDADRISIFVSAHIFFCALLVNSRVATLQAGLLSVVVAILLSVTIHDLRPSSQDTSAFYLTNIHKLLSKKNGSQVDIPSSLTNNPAVSFTPATAAIWVNFLLFLSLAISLICALLLTFLQQWAQRYLKLANPNVRSTQASADPRILC